ncbi:LrgB-like family-domain-containing protein [Whalleya microplaca]|nr:LrgB-like family-domain-containing protein [Whalleya microplaca]
MMSLFQQLSRSLQAPATAKRYRDAGIGLMFIALIQLLVVPAQMAMDLHSINLPASILVMLLCSLLMIIANCIHGGVAQFYTKHLQGPTDFLGRHMSFGFVASFVMLNRDHVTNALDVPKIAGAFVITTLVSYVAAFLLASGGFKLETAIRGRRMKSPDLESNNKSWPRPSESWPAPPTEGSPKRLSQLGRLNETLAQNGSLASLEPATQAPTSPYIDYIVRTAPVWICIFLLATVGIPIYFATSYGTPFEALCFILLWVISVQFQRCLKASCGLLQFPRLRSILIIFANPVMVTWALGTAFLWIKTAYTRQTMDTVISEFRRHDTLAQSVMNIAVDHNLAAHIGAGDLAGPVLDAGIVCLGFKMYEYRQELWASFSTVFSTCTVLAAINVFLNVLVAHALGLQAEDAVAFAARSVTIALGVPAVQNLGGSTALMSAFVIFGGIIFQMTGDWLFSVLHINDRRCSSAQKPAAEDGNDGSDAEKKSSSPSSSTLSGLFDIVGLGRGKDQQKSGGADDGRIVAAGVAVGINAAAMGTSHLIERDSRATAYSALSMTVFGAMTVALTAIPGVSEAMASMTSR